MKDIREYDEGRRDAADTLMLLDADNLPGELDRIMEMAQRSARWYAWHELLRYSAQHPRRKCELQMGMGDTQLVVECTNGGAWRLDSGTPDGRVQPPEFLDRLWAFGQAMGARHSDWFMTGIWVAHHGVMIEGELT
jgi:hypothetical protein